MLAYLVDERVGLFPHCLLHLLLESLHVGGRKAVGSLEHPGGIGYLGSNRAIVGQGLAKMLLLCLKNIGPARGVNSGSWLRACNGIGTGLGIGTIRR